jgi:hypothetical protein
MRAADCQEEPCGSDTGSGRGYYQEWGKGVQVFPGDAVNIPAGVKHWHGATPCSWFSHLNVENKYCILDKNRFGIKDIDKICL